MVNVIDNTGMEFPIENAWVFGLLILDLTMRLQKPSFGAGWSRSVHGPCTDRDSMSRWKRCFVVRY